jgi:hypothetical protein
MLLALAWIPTTTAPAPKAIHEAPKRASPGQVGSADPYRFGQQIQGIASDAWFPGRTASISLGHAHEEKYVCLCSLAPARPPAPPGTGPGGGQVVLSPGPRLQGRTYFCCKIEYNLAVKGVHC